MRLSRRRCVELSAGYGIAADRKRTQAERATEVLICRRDAVFLGAARCGIVDQVDATRWRNAIAAAEDLRLAGSRKRARDARRRRAQTVIAEIIEHADATIGIGIGH